MRVGFIIQNLSHDSTVYHLFYQFTLVMSWNMNLLHSNFRIFAILLFIVTLIFKTQHINASQGPRFKLNTCFRNNSIPSNECNTQHHPHCLGIGLPYRNVALPDQLPGLDLSRVEDVQVQLNRWQKVSKLPKCWQNFQVILCSIFMPQCEKDPITKQVIRVSKPSYDLCHDITTGDECRFIERHFGWPSFFNCSDTNLYMKDCTDELRDSKFQPSSRSCQPPLVYSEEPKFWLGDIANCTIDCKFPIVDEDDSFRIKLVITVLGLFGLSSTLIAVSTFSLDNIRLFPGSDSSKSDTILRYYTCSQLCLYSGWFLVIIFFLAGDNMACGSGGTPVIGSRAFRYCGISFFLTYIASLYNALCHAYLGRSIYYDLIGGKEVKNTNKSNPLNSASEIVLGVLKYLGPLVLFVIVAAFELVDGNGLYGICTTGNQSIVVKAIFILIPKTLGMLYGNFYLIESTRNIIQRKSKSTDPNRVMILTRVIPQAVLSVMELITASWLHLYEYDHNDSWKLAIERQVACNLDLNNELDGLRSPSLACALEFKPNWIFYSLDLISILTPGIIVASWTLRQDNIRKLFLQLNRPKSDYLGVELEDNNGRISPSRTSINSLASTTLSRSFFNRFPLGNFRRSQSRGPSPSVVSEQSYMQPASSYQDHLASSKLVPDPNHQSYLTSLFELLLQHQIQQQAMQQPFQQLTIQQHIAQAQALREIYKRDTVESGHIFNLDIVEHSTK